jgi:non-ribosomal peptide synthase protein (TIGR01720 family)
MDDDTCHFADNPAALIRYYESNGAIEMPLMVDQRQTLYAGLPDVNWLNLALFLALEEHVDIDIMQRSVRYVFDYHESLSIRAVKERELWRQFVVCDANAYCFQFVDHSELGPQERHEALDALIMEAITGLDIARGPVARIVFIDRGRHAPRQMLCVLHHIVFDATSIRILVGDIIRVYEQLAEKGTAELPAKTMHIQTWAVKLHQYANSSELREEVDYWTGLPWDRVPAVPTDYPLDLEKNTVESIRTVEGALSIEETESLMIDFAKAEGISAPDLVIAALVIVICPWAGGQWLSLGVHHAARDVVPGVAYTDLSRTVGWLSFQRLMLLQNPGTERGVHLSETIRAIHGQIQAIPRQGQGYALLRNCCEDADAQKALNAIPVPQVFFNYFGMLEEFVEAGPWSRAPDDGLLDGRWTHPRHKHDQLLLCSASIRQGRFTLGVGYSEHIFDRSTIEGLVQQVMSTIRGALQPYTGEATRVGGE